MSEDDKSDADLWADDPRLAASWTVWSIRARDEAILKRDKSKRPVGTLKRLSDSQTL